MPTREIYWNIDWGIAVYPIALLTLAVMSLGIYVRVARWRAGRPSEKPSDIPTRLRRTLVYAVGQARILREPYAGVMHLLLFCGFAVLFAGTLLVMVHEDFRVRILQGNFYLIYKLALNVFGLGAMVGVLMAAYRRYVVRARRLEQGTAFDLALGFIFLTLATGFLVEGLRIAASELTQHPDWAPWSIGGWGVALLVQGVGEETLRTLHRVSWWIHMLLAFTFLAYCVGWSTQSHILLGPLNVFLSRLGPRGALRTIGDFKDKRALGADVIQDLQWKDLVDADVCLRCGRCHESCPAASTGKPLSPRNIVQQIRTQMESESAGLPWPGRDARASTERGPIVGPSVTEDEIWSCTTCGACQQRCPVFVEPLSKIVELRRHQVMVKSRMPETAQAALVSLQKRGHPWTGTPHTRSAWSRDLSLGTEPQDGQSLLFWVGCSGALVDRNVLVSRAVARVLQHAGVDFFTLGDQETCCGDPARRIGNEFLFQTLAKNNVKLLQQHQVRTILTTCPHCYNTLKNEYPEFGGSFEVVHHTQLIADLLATGRIALDPRTAQSLTFHDPCYLGRQNDVYGPPRALAQAIAGKSFREMSRSRENSFCCGGGGGRAWMEESLGTRINQERAHEALRAGASAIGTACPYCLQMLEDGIKGIGAAEHLAAVDLAELVDQALQKAHCLSPDTSGSISR